MRVRDGDVAGPRTPLVEMIDPTSLLVRVAVPEAHAARLALGMKADIELDAYPQQTFSALVTRIFPTLDARTHTRLAELALIEHPVLLPGMFARVSLVRESVPDVITVPSYSLLATPGGGAAVMLVVDGKAVRRKVQIGIDADGRTRITDGLKPGDLLIVAGQETLKDGAVVQVVTTSGKSGTAKVDKPEVASTTSQNSTSPAKVKP